MNKSWLRDQKNFEGSLAKNHKDSLGFLASIRNSVAKQEFYKTRPKLIQKDLMGRTLGRVAASIDTRKNLAYAEANRALLNVDSTLRIHDLNLSWCDESLRNWASAKASECVSICEQLDEKSAVALARVYVESYGFVWPCYCLFGDEAALLRVQDEKWWRRQARVAKVRAMDQLARHFRMVHAKAQPYASNEAVKLRRAQVKRNRGTLEGFEAINQEGDTYTLAELSDLSVSNPTNRRHELMVRMRGFEQIAEQFGHTGLFITLSAPSRFHPMRQVKNVRGQLVRVEENPKYKGATPRDAQEWLNKTWSLIRAALDRLEIRCYGFRVVEPHADGCPHWHQLLFFSAENIEQVKSIFKKYSLRTDADEAGAAKYRLKIVLIDKERGSAAGYIAKYISKSIDGTHIDDDLLGNSGFEAAERICAWASSWGIRQFQQIGGGSVTVWRELRRLDSADGITEVARVAADSSDWAAYYLIQSNGLPFVSRSTAPIQAAYWLEHDSQTGEVIDESVNKYGEASRGKLFGLIAAGEYVLTRFYRWTVQRVGEAAKAAVKALPVCTLSPDDLLDLLRGDGLGSTA
ncbi:replication endonuclease [Cellvibrio sp. QJXJ]|uniref:replication endonuclease n=1 Tax=Cellvibrio sp. QJXJ TaxID=2964606 RepID=UPI0021C426AD|nr:replication endonuclease [Cellvibrio sp. QJXJ]UUA73546.1 replication endonuclease [Cellvibrio sp. QJXJ]